MPRRPEIEIDMTAHQWWWQADYTGAIPSERFTTANEIHVPVGAQGAAAAAGGDVIHSFWVPKLTGKTDVDPRPGQPHLARGRRAGVYRGQCSRILRAAARAHGVRGGRRAADAVRRMARARNCRPRRRPPLRRRREGLALVEYRCALCHTVRGTSAGSNVGPDLTHLMSRRTIAAGTLPNNRGIARRLDRGSRRASSPARRCPPSTSPGPNCRPSLAYLETLR